MRKGPFNLLITNEFLDDAQHATKILKEAPQQPDMKIIIASDHYHRHKDPVFQALGLTAENFLRQPTFVDDLVQQVQALLGEPSFNAGAEKPIETEPLPKPAATGIPVLFHDIRSPLLGVGAALQLLQKGKFGVLPEAARAEIDKIVARCTQLTQMADEYLLDIAQDKNTDQPQLEPLYLFEEVVDPVLHELAEDMQQSGCVLANQIEKTLLEGNRVILNGNKIWLKSVFRNLLSNAIKYGEKGGTIGIGIEKKNNHYQINVFNSVSSADKPGKNRKEAVSGQEKPVTQRGMGVGLHLTRRIINDYYGGDIWQETAENSTKFIFTLPYRESGTARLVN